MKEETQRIDLGFVNAYLIEVDDGFVLVDTGVPQQWAHLETELLQTGCLPDRLKLVLITHGDFDHTGNCARLQQQYHAKIAMHAGDVTMVKTGIAPKRHVRGLVMRILMRLTGLMGGRVECFEPDLVLEDGQALGDYGLAATVLHTPGHTRGSIAILTAGGQLFVGDTLSNRTRPDLPPLVENAKELCASIALLQRSAARVVYPGHGTPFPFEELASIRC